MRQRPPGPIPWNLKSNVLQNIEFGIVSVYREHPEMVDYAAMRSLEALIDHYVAQKIGRAPKRFSPDAVETEVFQRMKSLCDWRLGYSPGPGNIPPAKPLAPDEILQCLKRILKSTHHWNKQGGRRGYLDFVARYVR